MLSLVVSRMGWKLSVLLKRLEVALEEPLKRFPLLIVGNSVNNSLPPSPFLLWFALLVRMVSPEIVFALKFF